MTFASTIAQIGRESTPVLVLAAIRSDVEALVGGRCVITLDERVPVDGDWSAALGERGTIVVVGGDVSSHEPTLELAALIARGVFLQASEQSEQELRAILGAVIDGVITIEERGTIDSFNGAAEKMFGYTAAEVIGKNVKVLMGEHHATHHDGYLDHYIGTGERRIIGIGREVEAQKKDGTMFWLDLGVTEYRVRGIRKFTGILRDLTGRRELEAQLRQSQRVEAVGTLAAGVAHDFNNILMGIGSCLQLASTRMPEDASAQKFLQEARNAANRGSRLTRQLLDFSRRTPTEHFPLAFNEVVAGTESMLVRLVHEGVTLETNLAAEPDIVVGDAGQLEQVIVNLVINARDAMPDGGIVRLTTSNVTRSNRTFVRLAVVDTGHGMDAATTARVFEPFFTTKAPDKGTGLGLSTAYGIVEEHGGRINVQSAPGVGTTFEIDIPTSISS